MVVKNSYKHCYIYASSMLYSCLKGGVFMLDTCYLLTPSIRIL